MIALQIPNYHKNLLNAQPIIIKGRIIRPPPGVLGDIKVIPQLVIPPLNTDINFKNYLPSLSIAEYSGLRDIEPSKIPENFNWRENGDVRIRSNISKPPNQHLCGSCWAVSSASVISDNFVVTGKTKGNPNLSSTYILACYGQNKCSGGNPAQLMKTLGEGNGIATNHCLDYSWCSENNKCKPPVPPGTNMSQLMNVLSQQIPQCGCYNKGKFYLYFITNNSKTLNVQNQSDLMVAKHHIMNVGPVVTGFVVFSNFMKGFNHFTEQEGVYLENGVYDNEKFSLGDGNNTIVGSHAISVIGWGITKNPIIVSKNSSGSYIKKRVPYWYCRNSWGEEWGDGGYFKFAMYPYNKKSVIGKQVTIQTSTETIPGGGLILIEPKNYNSTNSLPYLNKVYSESKLSKPPSFYKNDPIPTSVKKPTPPTTPTPTTPPPQKLSGGAIAGIVIGSIIGFFLLIGIIMSIYYYFLGKNLIKYYKYKN